MISVEDKKRIMNEFITQILEKLRVSEDAVDWYFDYSVPSYLNLNSQVMWRGTDWRNSTLIEAIKYAYLKDYIKTEIVEVPKFGEGIESLSRYLLEMKGIDFWMEELGATAEEGRWDDINSYSDLLKNRGYTIYKVINYEGNDYIAVLNTRDRIPKSFVSIIWCNIIPMSYAILHEKDYWRDIDSNNPIVITPFSHSESHHFINWGLGKEPWKKEVKR